MPGFQRRGAANTHRSVTTTASAYPLLPALAAGVLAATAIVSLAAPDNLVDAGEPFGKLPLVDEVLCGDPADGHPFFQAPDGCSVVRRVLGTLCRVLPTEGAAKSFAYCVGRGKGLKPGSAYVLSLEYPEDAPRTFFIGNRGAETILGFSTGATVGDVFQGRYVNHNPESLRFPLSGGFETWKTLFYLHDRFPDIAMPRGEGPRPMVPGDGFWVVVSQSKGTNHPLSAGAALSRIRLFETPDPAAYDVALRLPPADLPRRHVFWREEMSDGAVHSRDEARRGVRNEIDWYEYKARLMRFWGFNTFCKDLLEFGHNQGWDSAIYGGSDWVNQTPYPQRWSRILQMVARYGFDVLPYYEYAGGVGAHSIGVQKRCKPLGTTREFTHITWSEKANADVTDPECLQDAKRVLEATIVRHREKVNFLGAWFRPRPSHMPIGFGEGALARFAEEVNAGATVTREALRADKPLLERYYQWWFGKRHDFLVALRDYLRATGVNPQAVLLFTADPSEPGAPLPAKQIVTDDPATWDRLVDEREEYKWTKVRPLREVIDAGEHLATLLAPRPTWGEWEWQHSCPQADPQRYTEADGVLITYTYNRSYTVRSPEAFDAFRSPSGLAIVRHYALNEHEMGDAVGYFVADVERSGPYCMFAEAQAMAHGDPRYIGYLASNSFNRGFPQHVRAFYSAFLSLPALPSSVLEDACDNPDIVVRAIPTPGHGIYYAVVNLALTARPGVVVKLPRASELSDAATGEPLPAPGGKVTLPLGPCRLRALHAD